MSTVRKPRTKYDEALGILHYAKDAWHITACGRRINAGPLGGKGQVGARCVTRKVSEVTCLTCQKYLDRKGL